MDVAVRATTESGSVYEFTKGSGYFRKNDNSWEACYDLRSVPPSALYTKMPSEAWPRVKIPRAGEHIYVSGKDFWWFSTPVKNIEFFA